MGDVPRASAGLGRRGDAYIPGMPEAVLLAPSGVLLCKHPSQQLLLIFSVLKCFDPAATGLTPKYLES